MHTATRLIVVALAFIILASAAWAEPTQVTVYVKSRGAKFIGTSMGGMKIFFEDAHSGEILASGLTAGSTGDTARIMKTVQGPGTTLTTPETAAYTASLDIDRPRLVTIRAYGPLAQPQAATEVSHRQWVLPGKSIVQGNAVTLELPGFAVDVLSPANHLKLEGIPQKVRIRANVTMMCGCGLEPGGLWDPADYEIQAIIRHKGEAYLTTEMSYAGQTSRFGAEAELEQSGLYEITVYAFDPVNGNVGLDHATVVVQQE